MKRLDFFRSDDGAFEAETFGFSNRDLATAIIRNHAAEHIRTAVAESCRIAAKDCRVQTFLSLCAWMLRAEAHDLGLQSPLLQVVAPINRIALRASAGFRMFAALEVEATLSSLDAPTATMETTLQSGRLGGNFEQEDTEETEALRAVLRWCLFVPRKSKSGFSIPPFGPLRSLLIKNIHLQSQPHFRVLPRVISSSSFQLLSYSLRTSTSCGSIVRSAETRAIPEVCGLRMVRRRSRDRSRRLAIPRRGRRGNLRGNATGGRGCHRCRTSGWSSGRSDRVHPWRG